MAIFEELKPILDYLSELKKVENYLIFNMSFPNTWKVPKKFIIDDKFVNQGVNEDNKIVLWFISEFDESQVNTTKSNILGIINYNLEREEKDLLLQNKIEELKNIFNKESLDSLKNLKFDIENKLKSKKDEKGKLNPLVQGVIEEGLD